MTRDSRVGLARAGAGPALALSIGAEVLAGDPVAAAAALKLRSGRRSARARQP